ncbi:MAG: hypothetical protein ACTSQX_07270 [Candidatus Heimdallarchaeota archaeon]
MTKISTKHFLITSLIAAVLLTCMFQTLQSNANGLNDDWKEFDPLGALGVQPIDEPTLQINAVDYNYTEIGSWSDAGSVHSIVVEEVEGTLYAYIADGANGLRILNITDPASPYEVGFYQDGAAVAYDVMLHDDYLYLSYGINGLVILDKDNKISPTKIAQVDAFLDGNESRGMDIDASYVYLACGLEGMAMIAISDPLHPAYLSSYSDGYFARDVAHGGSFAITTYQNHGVKVLQVGNPLDILLYGNFSTGDYYGISLDWTVSSRYGYIGSKDGLIVMNFWDAENPWIKLDASYIESETKVYDTFLLGNNVFACYENFGVRIFNITNRVVPVNDGIAGNYNDGGIGYDIYVDEFYGYLMDSTDGLEIVDLDPDKDSLYSGDEVNLYLTDPFDDDTDDDLVDDGEEILTYSTDPLDPDTDADTVIDGDEILTYLTDPLLNDTDDDTMLDGDEIFGVFYPTSPLANATGYIFPNPLLSDTDYDHLDDGIEYYIYGTDPMSNDTDGDGMEDDYEIINSLNATYDDALEDKDSDGLTNYEEYIERTNPSNNDSDSDLLLDGEEIFGYYNATHTHANATGYITTDSPLNDDLDQDGLLDGWEVLFYDTNPLVADSDNDGLDDFIEVMLAHTNPNNNDTDGDLIPDDWEYNMGTDPLVADIDDDPDNDDLTNWEEYQNDTDPTDSDTDDDDMPDGWEVANGLNPLVEDDYLDEDSDGLTNLEEYENGTNPLSDDTDGDSMDDFWEVDYGTDPLIDDADDDSETTIEGGPDGLTNLEEYVLGTDPHNADTDGDGLTDGSEVNVYHTNPLKSDSDDDGFTDGDEIAAGTDPNNPRSNPDQKLTLQITAISVSIALAIIIGVSLFLTFFWYLSPEQKLFRMIRNQKSEGVESISVKEATILVEKKLNRGQIKQLVNEHSETKKITLHNNRVWMTNVDELVANLETLTEKIDSFGGKPIKGKNLTELTSEITAYSSIAAKLGITELVTEFQALQETLDVVKEGKVEEEPPAEVFPEVDEKDFSSDDVADVDSIFESEPSEDNSAVESYEESDVDSTED